MGDKAQRRVLMQRWKQVQKLKDPASEKARQRVMAATADEPDPQFGYMHLAHAALQAAEGTGATWAEAMNRLLDRFAQKAKDEEASHGR